MSLSTTHTLKRYAGTGSLAPYPVDFQFLDAEDLRVIVQDSNGAQTVLALNTDYTVEGGKGSTGSVTLENAYDNTFAILIQRATRLVQPVDLVATGEFPPDVIEQQLDRTMMVLQETVGTSTGRIVRVTSDSAELQPVDAMNPANTVFGYDAEENLKLLTASELLILLSLPGEVINRPLAVWTDDSQRAAKVPNYVGQVGIQTDDSSMWTASGLSAGNWTLIPLNDSTLGGVSPSTRLTVTQKAVQDYINAKATVITDLVNNRIDELIGLVGTQGFVEVPVGGCLLWPGDPAVALPTGYMRAQGQLLSRTDYAILFNKIGTKWGSGDGSTTFALPDARGYFPRFRDAGAGRDPGASGRTASASGGASGDAVGSKQDEAFKAHSHALTDAGHNHASVVATTQTIQQGSGTSTPVVAGTIPANTSTNTTGATVASAGGAETRPINISFDLIIKVEALGEGATPFAVPFEVVAPSSAIPAVNTVIPMFRLPQNAIMSKVYALVWTLDTSGTLPKIQVRADGNNMLSSEVSCDETGSHVEQGWLAPTWAAGTKIDVKITETGAEPYKTPKGLVVWLFGMWQN